MDVPNLNINAVVSIADAVLAIVARHKASGSTEPLTNDAVHRELVAALQNGESAIAKEFAIKGWPLPQ